MVNSVGKPYNIICFVFIIDLRKTCDILYISIKQQFPLTDVMCLKRNFFKSWQGILVGLHISQPIIVNYNINTVKNQKLRKLTFSRQPASGDFRVFSTCFCGNFFCIIDFLLHKRNTIS